MNNKILFTGWVITHINGRDVIGHVYRYKRDAIKGHESPRYPWRKCYKLGWRVTKVNVCQPLKINT